MVARRGDNTFIFIRRSFGIVVDLSFSGSGSPLVGGWLGNVSERLGEWARLEMVLLSPRILSCSFLRTRVGMSSKSDVCRACLLPFVGDGLRLRLTDVDDIANDGTFRRGDLREVVRVIGEPCDT